MPASTPTFPEYDYSSGKENLTEAALNRPYYNSAIAGPSSVRSTNSNRDDSNSKLEDTTARSNYFINPRFGSKPYPVPSSTSPVPVPLSTDRTQDVQRRVDEVVVVMRENVDKLMDRGDYLHNLESHSADLQINAGTFQQSSEQASRALWWKKVNHNVLIVIILVGIILLLSVSFSSKKPFDIVDHTVDFARGQPAQPSPNKPTTPPALENPLVVPPVAQSGNPPTTPVSNPTVVPPVKSDANPPAATEIPASAAPTTPKEQQPPSQGDTPNPIPKTPGQ